MYRKSLSIILILICQLYSQPDNRYNPFDWVLYRQLGEITSVTEGFSYMYIGTESGGVVRIQRIGHNLEEPLTTAQGLKSNYISAVHFDFHTGNLWIAAGEYIHSSHTREGNWYIDNINDWGLPLQTVIMRMGSSPNYIWVQTSSGYVKLDHISGIFLGTYIFPDENKIQWSSSSQFPDYSIDHLSEYSLSDGWLSFGDGAVNPHGRDVRATVFYEVIVKVPVDENGILDVETVIKTIESVGDELALVFLPGVQYYSGQVLPIEQIIKVSHKVGALVGIQLAHGVGNIELELSNWNVDFATWCTYKYLNSGPGSIAACYINEKHVNRKDIQRLHGWWGNSLETRFEMENQFDEKNTADVWQVSNPPILSMAPIKAAMDLIIEAGGMKALRKKSINMSMYFDYLIEENLYDDIQIITPQDTDSRGCQLSLKVVNSKLTGRGVFNSLLSSGVACDWRYPDVIRVAPVPMYNSYLEIYNFVEILRKIINE